MALAVKNPSASAADIRDASSAPGLGRSPGEGNGNPLQYSCLENPMDRGAWWAAICGVTESQTRLSNLTRTHQDSISVAVERGHVTYIRPSHLGHENWGLG